MNDGDLQIEGGWPSTENLAEALLVTARELDVWTCYAYLGAFHFPLGGGWSIALSTESAGRIRVETCRLCRPETRMWVLAKAHDRLAGLVARLASEVAEPV